MEDEKSTCRPQKLSEPSRRGVTSALLANQRQTFVDITNQYGFDVQHWTVRKALHDIGFYNRVAQKKPFFSDAHKRKGFEFASKHQIGLVRSGRR